MDINKIKDLPISAYMEEMGYTVIKKKGVKLVYAAEWRGGDDPNVWVDTKLNLWKDHSGKSQPPQGDIIDLCQAIHGCSKHEALQRLTQWSDGGVVKAPEYIANIPTEQGSGLQVVEVKRITHEALKEYLKDRCISLRTAQRYCKEIHLLFSTGKKGFFIGFPNVSGGWAARNPLPKGKLSTKQDISVISVKDSTVYRIFEGFFDFLSFVEINGDPQTNCIVLNSIVNLPKVQPYLENATRIVLTLDNDESGKECSRQIMGLYGDIVVDESGLFEPYKDINEYLVKDRAKNIGKRRYFSDLVEDPNTPNEFHIKIPSKLIEERARCANDNIYLSEFLTELPMNCVFLKGATGCGATTLALSDTHNSIVAMPTRATVESKWLKRDIKNPTDESKFEYRTDLLPFYGGLYTDEFTTLKEYLERCDKDGLPIKIVCTYDQVEKVFMWLSGKIFDKDTKEYRQCNSASYLNRDVRSFRLYIDEIHQCYKDWATDSRRKSIRGMLRCVSEFNEVCFITATPMKREHFFPEMKDFNIVSVDYNVKMPEPVIETAGYIKNAVANKIVAHLNGEIVGNAHFFVNSVNFIKDVMAKITQKGLYQDGLFRVVCGDTEKNKAKIREAVKGQKGKEAVEKMAQAIGENENLPVKSINSPVAKINFYTSTAFQGADIFDTTARVYIVSDTSNVYTLVNVDTDYKQILGRVRDAYDRKATHIINPKKSRYWLKDGVSVNQYQKDKEARLEQSQDILQLKPEILRQFMETEEEREKMKARWYLLEDESTGEIYQDKVLEWLDDDNNENILNYQSPATIKASLLLHNIDASIGEKANDEWDNVKKERQNFQKNFLWYADKMKRVATLFEDNPIARDEIEFIRRNDPLVADAYNLLGEDKVRLLGYKRAVIKKEVKVEKLLRKKGRLIKVMKQHSGKSYTTAEMDEVCTKLQAMFGLEKKPNFSEYFTVKATTKREKESGKIVKAQRIESLRE